MKLFQRPEHKDRYYLEVKSDEDPKFIYKKKILDENATIYWACEDTGFVSFYYHNKGYEKGFYEHVFTLTMEDGTVEKIKGPWSSCSSSMNAYFPHSVEITRITKEGYRIAGYMLVDKVREILDKDFEIIQSNDAYGYKIRKTER